MGELDGDSVLLNVICVIAQILDTLPNKQTNKQTK